MFLSRRLDDSRLVRQALEGEGTAFGGLVERYSSAVFGVALAHLRNRADAEDLTQDVFLAAYKSLHTLRERKKLGPWLIRLTKNRCLNVLRRRKLEQSLPERLEKAADGIEPEPDRKELHRLLHQEMDALDDDAREILMLHYFSRKSTREIGQLLGVSPGTAAKRLQRARAALGERVVDALGDELEHQDRPEDRKAQIMGVVATATPLWKGMSPAEAAASGAAAWSAVFGVFSGPALMKVLLAFAVLLAATAAGWWATQQRGRNATGHDSLASPAASGAISDEDDIVHTVHTAQDITQGAAPSQDATAPTAPSGVSVSGVVLSPTGMGALDAEVTAFTKEPELQRTSTTQQDGSFEMSGFPPGSLVCIQARTDRLMSKRHGPVPLTENGLHGLSLQLLVPGGLGGVVVDLPGRPVAGANVVARPSDDAQESVYVVADDQGVFLFAKLLPIEHTLTPEPPDGEGALSCHCQIVQVQPGILRKDLKLVLDTGGDLAIAGRVTDTDGEPIEGAFVRIWQSIQERWATRTDKKGEYVIAGLSDATYGVQANLNGYALCTNWDVRAGSEGVNFVLPRTQTAFAGRVVRADTGEPLQDFEVLVVPGGNLGSMQQFRQWDFKPFSDPDGRFRVDGVQNTGDAYVLYLARAEGYAVGQALVRMGEGEDAEEPVVKLAAGAVVEGVVVDDEGRPVPGGRIIAEELRNLDNVDQLTDTIADADGAFRLEGMSSDITTISAYHPDYPVGMVDVSLTPGQTTQVRIVLAEGGIVEGRVTRDGRPVADASIRLEAPVTVLILNLGDGANSQLSTRTDLHGKYRFSSVKSGKAEVSAFDPATGEELRRLIQPVVVAQGRVTHANFDLQTWGGSVEGLVHLAGTPAKEGFVRLYGSTASGREFRHCPLEGGSFRADGLPPGAILLEVRPSFEGPRTVVRTKSVEVAIEDNAVNQVDVDFATGGSIAGSVIDLQDGETGWVDVFAGTLDGDQLMTAPYGQLIWQGPLRDDGTFEATGFDPGTYTVRVVAKIENAKDGCKPRVLGMVVDAVDGQETWLELSSR
jgi:RNA polymerase sigma-70 factor, ECF subfamily